MSLNTTGSTIQSIFPSAAQRSQADPSIVLAPSEFVPGLAGSPFMPTSTADISALRNAARVSVR
jgi:hypothetical protein